MILVLWLLAFGAGVGLIVWGAEAFAEHLGRASVQLGVSSFALALLLAGAEPEELVTSVVASLRGSPGIALGDVVGANVVICLVALGVGTWLTPLPFRGAAMRYALLGLPLGAVSAWFAWDGEVSRTEGLILVALYVARRFLAPELVPKGLLLRFHGQTVSWFGAPTKAGGRYRPTRLWDCRAYKILRSPKSGPQRPFEEKSKNGAGNDSIQGERRCDCCRRND